MSKTLASSMTEYAMEVSQSASDAAVTIAGRMPILAGCFVAPTPAGFAEWQEACSEKIMATWDGAAAAFSGMQDVLWRSLMSPLTPAGMAHEALVLVRAVNRPGQVCVRANAERFRQP